MAQRQIGNKKQIKNGTKNRLSIVQENCCILEKKIKWISEKNERFPGYMWEYNPALTGQTENREKENSWLPLEMCGQLS